MPVDYDPALVVLSYVITAVASAAALLIAWRVRNDVERRGKAFWLSLGALTLGTGVWAMHFVGMLAMSLPVPISYDFAGTTVSILPAIVAGAVCLFGAIRGSTGWLVGGGVVMGAGIGAMHYAGMAAMRVGAEMFYDARLFALSIAVAASLAVASLYTVRWSLRQTAASPATALAASGALMGLAVTAMHYTGMWAATFLPLPAGTAGEPVAGMDAVHLAIPVAVAILVIVVLAVAAVAMDYRFKQLREAAISEAAKFDQLLEAVPDGVVVVNAVGEIRLLNSRIEGLFRYPKTALLGRAFETLMPGFAASGARERALTAPAAGSGLADSRLELAGLRADRSEFPAEISLNRVATPEGPLLICAIRDVTDQERARQALREANERLTAGMKNLETQSQELRHLTDMSELLHACEQEKEAYEIIHHSVAQLLPDTPGAVYMLSRSRNVLQMAASWGATPNGLQPVFDPTECWALRRGRLYVASPAHPSIRCGHAKDHADGYICVPMLAHGEVVGILHVLAASGREASSDSSLERMRILLVAIAEKISTAVASLRLREELRNQSIRDPLTGLLNRRYMEEAVEREIVRANRTSTRLSFVAVDLDHFKRFNDTFGHEGGDLVLREVGSVLSRSARGDNLACRLGGEELLMILPDTPLDDALALAEKIRRKIEKLSVALRDQQLGKITASFGVAEYPSHGEGHREVLRAADEALYRAKAAGRNRVEAARRADDTLSVSIKAMKSPP